MDVYHTTLLRRSCRNYLNKGVEEDKIKTILEAAMAAPSAINRQPWEFFIIENKETQNKIKSLYPAWDKNSPCLVLVCGNSDSFIAGLEEYYMQDCSAAIENMLLTATELGLGSLWCGVMPSKERSEAITNVLNLNSKYVPFALIHFGYAAVEPAPRTQYDENKIHRIK